MALGDLLDVLDAQTDVRYSGFGVLAVEVATVSNIVWNGVQYNFEPAVVAAPTTITTVTPAEVAHSEDVYKGWHEGYTTRRVHTR